MAFGKKRGDYRRLAIGFLLYVFILLTLTAIIHAHTDEDPEAVGEPESLLIYTIVAAFLCTLILYFVFDRRNVKENGMRASILTGYLFTFIILAGLGYGYDTWQQSDTETIVECDTPENCNMYRHIHAYVNVYECGSNTPYLFPLQAGGANLLHTHHEENRIHWHQKLKLDPEKMSIAPTEEEKILLGSFFDRMNTQFSSDEKTCINGKCDGDTCDNGQVGQWVMYVDEQPTNEWREYYWYDEEHIELRFTTDATQINEWNTNARIIRNEAETFTRFPVTLGVVIGFSAVDSVNPCAFGVLIFLITYLVKSGKRKKDLLIHGGIYIFFVFLTYILAGLILLTFITQFASAFQAFSNFFYYVLAIIVILFGLMELRDYIKEKLHPGEYHATMAIRPTMKKKIEEITYTIVDKKSTSAFLGFFVSLVELPCTGAVYLAILAAMAFEGFTLNNIVLLLIYNIIFVLPLIAILLLVYKGMTTFEFKRWYMKNKGKMRLLIAIVLIGMGIWLLESIGFFTLFEQWITQPGSWKVLLIILVASLMLTFWRLHHARSNHREETAPIDHTHEPHTAAEEHHEQVTAIVLQPKLLEDHHIDISDQLKELEKITPKKTVTKKTAKKRVRKLVTKTTPKKKTTKKVAQKRKRRVVKKTTPKKKTTKEIVRKTTKKKRQVVKRRTKRRR